MSYFKMFRMATIVLAWLGRAFDDGKIDMDELVELIEKLARVLGIELEWDVSQELIDAMQNGVNDNG